MILKERLLPGTGNLELVIVCTSTRGPYVNRSVQSRQERSDDVCRTNLLCSNKERSLRSFVQGKLCTACDRELKMEKV
jgi:hypothetical protein